MNEPRPETAIGSSWVQDELYSLKARIEETPVPLERQASAEEMADLIVFLLSDRAAYVHGAVLFADGGTDAVRRPDAF